MNETNETMAADNCPTFEGLGKQARVPGGRFQFLINDIPWLMSINIRGASLQVHMWGKLLDDGSRVLSVFDSVSCYGRLWCNLNASLISSHKFRTVEILEETVQVLEGSIRVDRL